MGNAVGVMPGPVGVDRSFFGRLSILRLPLILLVVFHHAETGGDFISKMGSQPFLAAIVDWIAHGLAGVRMPVFFVIAGYVTFFNFSPDKKWFLRKIRSRARTVLLPLVLWTSLTMALFLLVHYLPFFSGYFSGSSIWSLSVLEMSPQQFFAAYLGRDNELYLYPLWFLRDLFFLILVSPIVYGAVQYSRGWGAVVMAAVWFFDLDKELIRDSWLFFVVGAQLAIFGKSIFIADKWGPVSLAGWVLLQATHAETWCAYMAPVKTLLGIAGILYASGLVVKISPVSTRLQQWSKYSFFLFVAHEPLLTLVRKIFLRLAAPTSANGYFLVYFLIVASVVTILFIVFELAERTVPRALDLMTGGRAGRSENSQGRRSPIVVATAP